MQRFLFLLQKHWLLRCFCRLRRFDGFAQKIKTQNKYQSFRRLRWQNRRKQRCYLTSMCFLTSGSKTLSAVWTWATSLSTVVSVSEVCFAKQAHWCSLLHRKSGVLVPPFTHLLFNHGDFGTWPRKKVRGQEKKMFGHHLLVSSKVCFRDFPEISQHSVPSVFAVRADPAPKRREFHVYDRQVMNAA